MTKIAHMAICLELRKALGTEPETMLWLDFRKCSRNRLGGGRNDLVHNGKHNTCKEQRWCVTAKKGANASLFRHNYGQELKQGKVDTHTHKHTHINSIMFKLLNLPRL